MREGEEIKTHSNLFEFITFGTYIWIFFVCVCVCVYICLCVSICLSNFLLS